MVLSHFPQTRQHTRSSSRRRRFCSLTRLERAIAGYGSRSTSLSSCVWSLIYHSEGAPAILLVSRLTQGAEFFSNGLGWLCSVARIRRLYQPSLRITREGPPAGLGNVVAVCAQLTFGLCDARGTKVPVDVALASSAPMAGIWSHCFRVSLLLLLSKRVYPPCMFRLLLLFRLFFFA